MTVIAIENNQTAALNILLRIMIVQREKNINFELYNSIREFCANHPAEIKICQEKNA